MHAFFYKRREKAKRMFLQYGGNSYLMSRDGVLRTYQRFRIRPELEKQWLKELIDEVIVRLNLGELDALYDLSRTGSVIALTELSGKVDYKDDYEKLRYANTIYELCHMNQDNRSLVEKSLPEAKSLYREIVHASLGVESKNKEHFDEMMLESLEAATPEEYCFNYAKDMLSEINGIQHAS